eukprot:scaffold22593_cov145-Cylindrotheca_fusiformis.AAC.7
MSTLRELLLKNNDLSGTIPLFLADLTNLEVLFLEQNKFAEEGEIGFCSREQGVNTFVADCGDGGSLQCDCCSKCCDAGDDSCNVRESSAGLDPVREYSEIPKSEYLSV